MANQYDRNYSVKNRNFQADEGGQKQKVTRHFTNQVYKSEQIVSAKPPKDTERVAELMRLAEEIRVELLRVKLCLGCKRKFSCMDSLFNHEERCAEKKVKIG